MSYATEHIATTLKAAREARGLSQRALSKTAGVPQGHISKIENGAVDLRLSSLIALARALDLELTLVPRKALPAVQAVVRSSERTAGPIGENTRLAHRELERLQQTLASFPAAAAPQEVAQLQRQLRELGHFPVSDVQALKAAHKSAREFLDNHDPAVLREAVSQLRELRNWLAHASAQARPGETVRPAYSLDEDEHG
jgi:transcriptional regulator with XRE-family HTH domain